jgi:hypothetical protein
MSVQRARRSAIAAAVLMSLAALDARAAGPEADAAQRGLIARYVGALAAQDETGLRKLFHPAVLACITSENRDFFDTLVAKDLSHGQELRAGYAVTRLEPVAAGAATSSMPELLAMPVAPTHEFQIDTPLDDRNHSLAVIRTIASLDGAWFLVVECPTAKGVAFFRERRAAGERQRIHARQLAHDLPQPLLSELKALLVERRRIDAIKRYRAAADVDLTTASQVIDVLEAK